jgi:hypothetical protein
MDDWWTPHRLEQLDLWQSQRDEFLARARISADEVYRFFERGWLSFDIRTKHELSYPEVMEIQFIRSLAHSGLSDAMVENMLSGLEKPYRYDFNKIAYSFLYGWVERPRNALDDLDDHDFEAMVQRKLQECVREGNWHIPLHLKLMADRTWLEARDTHEKLEEKHRAYLQKNQE